jgi:hypothetical protein
MGREIVRTTSCALRAHTLLADVLRGAHRPQAAGEQFRRVPGAHRDGDSGIDGLALLHVLFRVHYTASKNKNDPSISASR